MNKVLRTMLLSSFFLFGCMATPQGTSFEKVLYEVKRDMFNPETIQIREAQWVRFVAVTGEDAYGFRFGLNGENALGGMTGFQSYFAFHYLDSDYILFEDETGTIKTTINYAFDWGDEKGTFSEAQINAILSRI